MKKLTPVFSLFNETVFCDRRGFMYSKVYKTPYGSSTLVDLLLECGIPFEYVDVGSDADVGMKYWDGKFTLEKFLENSIYILMDANLIFFDLPDDAGCVELFKSNCFGEWSVILDTKDPALDIADILAGRWTKKHEGSAFRQTGFFGPGPDGKYCRTYESTLSHVGVVYLLLTRSGFERLRVTKPGSDCAEYASGDDRFDWAADSKAKTAEFILPDGAGSIVVSIGRSPDAAERDPSFLKQIELHTPDPALELDGLLSGQRG